MFGLPGLLARPLGRRIQAVDAAADAVAARHGTVHFDAADLPCTYDRRMWSVDRLHPSERGHRFLATSFFDLVAAQLGVPANRRPDPEPRNPEPTLAAKAWWMATRGTKWLLDRSTDRVPSLLRLALAEFRDGSPSAVEDGSLGWGVWHDQTGARPTTFAQLPSPGSGACIQRARS